MSQHVRCCVWLHATAPVTHEAGPCPVQRPCVQFEEEISPDGAGVQLAYGVVAAVFFSRDLYLAFI